MTLWFLVGKDNWIGLIYHSPAQTLLLENCTGLMCHSSRDTYYSNIEQIGGQISRKYLL
jgi:hypothetical protein